MLAVLFYIDLMRFASRKSTDMPKYGIDIDIILFNNLRKLTGLKTRGLL